MRWNFVCLWMFYVQVNPLRSCRARSVYLTTFFPGMFIPLSRLTSTCTHSFARNWQLPFLNRRKGENDRRKHFMINLQKKNVAGLGGDRPRDLLITSRTQLLKERQTMLTMIWSRRTRRLIRIYTALLSPVCSGMSVQILIINTAVISTH